MLPNVIIAGTQKAGTTSLFRYLADHPSVCPSSIKEVDFFLKYNDEIDMGAVMAFRIVGLHMIQVQAPILRFLFSKYSRIRSGDFAKDKGVRFMGIHRIFDEGAFRRRGMPSVQDLTALTRLWEQSEELLQHTEKLE